ncbi:Uu.00g011330.m01.CDS01 [Anthostomella pinea]|uniref:Uu.00g011330.m01.CDS01 n=1 Tax=Anthostomella pinea TaxID=933095 RepID=A0AAI8VXQ3_9PEZI|nr:Uu.00g011330.m01.CDS01 [Anthostomella pinea]
MAAFAATASASALPDVPGLPIAARYSAPKVNEYVNDNCTDDSGGNAPQYPHRPPLQACVEISSDEDTKGVWVSKGSTPATGGKGAAYSEHGCNGNSFDILSLNDQCVKTQVKRFDGFDSIKSIKYT